MDFRDKARVAQWLIVLLLVPVAVAFQASSFDDEFRQGLIALQHKDLTAARDSLERASQLQPQNPKVWVALAQVYLGSKQVEQANAAAKRAESLAGDDPVVQHALSIFFAGTGDFAKAAEMERQFAASKSADPQAAARAAALSLQAGQPQQAITWAKAALGQTDNADLRSSSGNSGRSGKPARGGHCGLAPRRGIGAGQ